MSINTTQYIKAQSSASVNIHPSAGGGSVVFVKILKNNGGGSCTVSFAGNKFNVKSEIPLKEGQSFKAVLKSDGNRIMLVPQETEGRAESVQRGQTPMILEQSVLPDGTPGAQLAVYLSKMGLVPDKAAVTIMQFLQQTGLKLDTSIMQKAQRLALKFPGKEKKAAEAAILLLENGISSDEELLEKILAIFEHEGTDPSDQNSAQSDQNGTPSDQSFLNNLFTNNLPSHEGLLSFLNHYARNRHHWIILPYEFSLQNEKATGLLRFLLDKEEKKVEKILINCNFSVKKLFFVLKLIQSKVVEVRFCTLPPLLPSDVTAEEKRLGGFFNSGMNKENPVAITYSASALINDICTDSEQPLFIGGES